MFALNRLMCAFPGPSLCVLLCVLVPDLMYRDAYRMYLDAYRMYLDAYLMYLDAYLMYLDAYLMYIDAYLMYLDAYKLCAVPRIRLTVVRTHGRTHVRTHKDTFKETYKRRNPEPKRQTLVARRPSHTLNTNSVYPTLN